MTVFFSIQVVPLSKDLNEFTSPTIRGEIRNRIDSKIRKEDIEVRFVELDRIEIELQRRLSEEIPII
jgi:hypothetical protein